MTPQLFLVLTTLLSAVTADEPATVIGMPTEVVAVEGKTREIECRTSGVPKPVVTWFKENDGRLLVAVNSNGSLILRNVSKDDEGNYTCQAENSLGLEETTVRVRVVQRTAILAGPGDVSILVLQSPVLYCTATADPQDLDELQLHWERGGIPLPEGERYQFYQERDGQAVRGWLQLNEIHGRDSDRYRCRAQSPHDSAISAPAQVTVLRLPDPPYIEDFQCNSTAFSATITWSSNQTIPPVQFFEVEYSTLPNMTRWTSAANVEAPLMTATVLLHPYSTFVLRVVSRNAVGASDPSYQSSQCQTQATRPNLNPTNVRAIGSRRDYLSIEWTPMPEWELNGPGFQYRVSFRKSNDISQPRLITIDDWRNSSYVHHTPEPRMIPTDITVSDIASTSAVLTFTFDLRSAINDSISPMNGKFHGFKVYSWEEGKRAETLQESSVDADDVESTGGGKARVTVRGLTPYTRTQLAIAARNTFYRGPLSHTVSFATLAAEPGLVEEIRTQKMTSSSLQVEWEPPLLSYGAITGYNMAVQQVYGLHLGFLYYVIDGQNVTSAHVPDLDAGATYRLYLSACNAIGCGEANFIDVTTADAGSDVTREYDVKEVCKDRVRVTWNVSPRDVNNSAIYVRYRQTGARFWQTTGEEQVRICADSNDRASRPWWRVIQGLHSDTSYELQLVIRPSGQDVITSYVTTVVTPSGETSACSHGDTAATMASPGLPFEDCKQKPSTTTTTTATTNTTTNTNTNTNTTSDVTIREIFPPQPKSTSGPTSSSAQILPSLAVSFFTLIGGMILTCRGPHPSCAWWRYTPLQPGCAFSNMRRGGCMCDLTKTWRRWHRRINLNWQCYALCSAMAASGATSLALAKGHKVDMNCHAAA